VETTDIAMKPDTFMRPFFKATEPGWDNFKGSFKEGYETSKEGFQQTRQWVSDKIAP